MMAREEEKMINFGKVSLSFDDGKTWEEFDCKDAVQFEGDGVETINIKLTEKKKTLSDKSFTAETRPETTKMYCEENVKQHIKEFIKIILDNRSNLNEHYCMTKAKEIMGDRLI